MASRRCPVMSQYRASRSISSQACPVWPAARKWASAFEVYGYAFLARKPG